MIVCSELLLRKSCGEKSRDSFEKEEQADAGHRDFAR